MKKIYFLFLLMLLPLVASADAVEINGIYYNLNTEEKTAEVTANPSKYSGDLVIPDIVNYTGLKYDVTSIAGGSKNGGGAFYECSGLTSVSIPKSIETIGYSAFHGCTSLNAVNITDLSSWCNIDFKIIIGLDPWDLSVNPLYYAHNLYLNGDKISKLVIPENISVIKAAAFAGGNFNTILFHKQVNTINSFAFDECNNLTDVYSYSPQIGLNDRRQIFTNIIKTATLHVRERFVNNYQEGYASHNYNIGWKDFGKVEYIEGIDFNLSYLVDNEVYETIIKEYGESITKEEEPSKEGYTFSGWSEIPETMPDHDVTVTGNFIINKYKLTYKVDGEIYKTYDIEYNSAITTEKAPTRKGMTFSGWSEIPETMPAKDIEVTGKFSWSQVVKDNVVYEVRDTINNYAVVVDGKDLEGEVTIKSSVEFDGEKYTINEVAKDAFYWDTNVFTSVIIPDCITTIGSWAFKERKSLKKVEIGSGITSIGKRAFADIDNLETVTIHAENVPETDRTTFENSYLNYVTLYVPASSLGKYKDAAPWNEFKDIVALDEEADDNLDVITIKDIGKTTYCCEYDLDFTDVEGIKAYTATGYDNIDKTIWLTRVMKVPAGTGILVKGDAGTYKVPRSNVDAYYTNMFKGNTGDPIKIEETDGDMTNYYLSGSDGQFKSVNGSANIGKNKAYLQLPTKFFAGTRSIGVTYDDEGTTGIWTIEQGALKSERDVWYNLQGQRVDKPKKGLYIRNGRKVVVR